MEKYRFSVPETRRMRVIVDTDCKNEADDQFALAHFLMTPIFDIRGIVAAHFGNTDRFAPKTSVEASYDEIIKVMELMGLAGRYPVAQGAAGPIPDEDTPIDSPGARLIIEEAMRDDERPLYVCLLGAITDLACAYLMEPRIAGRLTAVWVGGGTYPTGGREFNLCGDINAVNVVFGSDIPVRQAPRDVYKQLNVSLAELQLRVRPCGAIGKYLFEQMAEFNAVMGKTPGRWPHGETWCLGDQAAIAILMEDYAAQTYSLLPAPRVRPDGIYEPGRMCRPIRVYHTVDSRATLEDLYAKLMINYPPEFMKGFI